MLVDDWSSVSKPTHKTICSLCRLFALHSAPTAAALQTITPGTLSLSPAVRGCTGADTFRRHLKTHFFQQASNPLGAFLLAPQIRHPLTTVRVYKLYFLTYLPGELAKRTTNKSNPWHCSRYSNVKRLSPVFAHNSFTKHWLSQQCAGSL